MRWKLEVTIGFVRGCGQRLPLTRAVLVEVGERSSAGGDESKLKKWWQHLEIILAEKVWMCSGRFCVCVIYFKKDG